MNITVLLKKIYKKIGRENSVAFAVDIDKQLKYLKSLNEPEDDFERSFNQYKCQQFLLPYWERCFKSIASFFLLPVYLIILRIKSKSVITGKRYDAVFVQNGMGKNIIPASIQDKYKKIKVVSFTEKMALGNDEIRLIFECIKRHPVSPYFHLKVLLKTAIYCAHIKESQPKAIISYCETSFSSAVVTKYCEMKRIAHINVMHGDFLKRITFSYFRFTVFYVWDEYYIDMFKSLGNDNTKYLVEIPVALKDACRRPSAKEEYPYFLTYYLGNEDEKTMKNINAVLKIISKKGIQCKVRMHPRESDIKTVQKIFCDIRIEDPKEVSLEDSLNKTNYACALCSTVLFQAWACGKKIMIDDCSNVKDYETLRKLGYMLLEKKPRLLSDLLRELGG